MKMRKVMAVGLAATMAFGLAACGGSKNESTNGGSNSSSAKSNATASKGFDISQIVKAEKGSGKDVGDITLVMSQRDEWLSTLEEGAKLAADYLGVKLSTQDSQSDTSKQIQFVQTAATAGQKVCIVNMVDPTTAESIIDAAGGMKVVFVNRVPSDTTVLNENAVYVGSDENTSGKFQGDWLAKYFKDKGKTSIKYILLNGILGQTSTTLRTESVLKALKDNGIDAKEASAPLACDYDRATAQDQITPLLTSGTEFDCIISNNDAMALGAIEACETNGVDIDFPIVGIDASADGRQAVKDGKLSMSVFQDPHGQGGAALVAAINLVNGNKLNDGTNFEVDKENGHILWVPFEEVNSENVAEYDNR